MRMFVMMLPILLGAGPAVEVPITSTSSEVRRAHEMFQGVWLFTSMNDNGETLGPELIQKAFAQNSQVTVKNRTFVIVNPESGNSKTATFRLDPSKTPRQIDMIDPDDRLYRGIYRFEGDSLFICLQRDHDAPRPAEFEAPVGSNQVLFRLTPTTLKEATKTASLNVASEDLLSSSVTPPELTAPDRSKPTDTTASTTSVTDQPKTSATGERKATEAEIRRAHQLLAGEWDILSIIDDGSNVGPTLIRTKFAEDGRLRIGNRVASFTTPNTEEKHISAIRINPAKNPSWIDLTTQLDSVLKGIYKFDGDKLVLCLAKHDSGMRPTEFEAPSGSDRVLFRLAVAKPDPKPAATPAPTPTPTAATTPTAEDKERQKEQRIREMLAGSWAYNDEKGQVTLILRSDGSFVATRAWSKAIKRMFEGQTTTSDGRWTYAHGLLTGRIYSTTSPSMVGHGFSARLQSIGENSLVFKDVVGELKTARKLR